MHHPVRARKANLHDHISQYQAALPGRTRVNAFEYLQALQTHVEDVLACPALWLPWNYREQLLPRLAMAA